MTEHYKVRVTKDHLVFCSGHFISYEGDKCERLHGHNYRTSVEVEGELDANRYVFDFIALKHRTKAITDELDHRMMLPTRNPLIRVEEEARSRPRPLSGPRMAVSARRLRAAADREHHGRAAGRRTSPAAWPTTCSGCTATAPPCCAWRSRRASASRRRANCGRHSAFPVARASAGRRAGPTRPAPSARRTPSAAAGLPGRGRRRRRSPPRPGCAAVSRAHSSSVPVPSPTPTRARSSTISRRTPSATARSAISVGVRRSPRRRRRRVVFPPLRSREKTIDPPKASHASARTAGPATVSSPITMSRDARRPPTAATRPNSRTPASIQRRKPSAANSA